MTGAGNSAGPFPTELSLGEDARHAALSQAAILEQIAEGVIVTDAAGHIIFVNRAAEALHGVKLLGVKPDEYSRTYHLLTDVGEPYPPENLPLARAVRTGETVADVRWRIKRPDGSVVRAIGSARPLLDADGKQTGAVLTLRDDTARVDAEEARRRGEERLSIAQSAARIGTYDYSLADGHMFWSPEMFSIYGIPSREDSVSLTEWRRFVHPADRPQTVYADTFGKPEVGKSYSHEYRIVREDGEVRWLEARAIVHPDEFGRPGRIVGVNIDITERKRTEHALEVSRSRLLLAQRAARAVTWEWDVKRNQLLWNDLATAREVAGADLSEATPGEQWARRIHPDDLEQHRYDVCQALKAGSGLISIRIVHKGEVRWLEAQGQVSVRDEKGRALAFAGIILDVSERKRHELQQQVLIGELNHRAKNLLTIVQSIARQTLKDPHLPPELNQKFEARLGALAAAHDLLMVENWRAPHLGRVIAEAVASVCPMDDRVTLVGPEVPLGPKTAVSVAMAVHELATNALKYGSLSAASGSVNVRWSSAGGRLSLIWQEEGGPPVSTPRQRGFGTRMIERALAAELRGTVELKFEPQGLRCTIDGTLPTLPAHIDALTPTFDLNASEPADRTWNGQS